MTSLPNWYRMRKLMKRIAAGVSIATGVLLVTPGAHSQAKDADGHRWSFGEIFSNHNASKAFNEMRKGCALPSWVTHDVAESPAETVLFGGETAYVMSACKPHNCGNQRIAVMYIPKENVMYGLLSVSYGLLSVSGKPYRETLAWLNIGGGNESIDGKTILYAGLTGSLGNHRGQFNLR